MKTSKAITKDQYELIKAVSADSVKAALAAQKALDEEEGEEEEDATVEKKDLVLKSLTTTLDEVRPYITNELEAQLERHISQLRLTEDESDSEFLIQVFNFIQQLPWGQEAGDLPSPEKLKKILDKDHFGMNKVKDSILNFYISLKVAAKQKKSVGKILLLVGPPGVGKTTLTSSIGKALNRPIYTIYSAGISFDGLNGVMKHIRSSAPGKLMQAFLETKSVSPVILFDEIDKASDEVKNSLLEIFDPNQNKHYKDRFLEIPFDISNAIFICTANDIDQIPAPLLSRVEVIELSSYTEEEKLHIAQKHIIPAVRESLDFYKHQFTITPFALNVIISAYTNEGGVRELKQKINEIATKVKKEFLLQHKRRNYGKEINLTLEVEKYLGAPVNTHEKGSTVSSVGKINGLTFSPDGGYIQLIECVRMPAVNSAGGDITITGNVGSIMKESIQLAYSSILAQSERLGIPINRFEKANFHFHLPDASTEIDGPSAGSPIFLNFYSVLTGKAIPSDYAFSGELTLFGEIKAVGGIKEKILAAVRAKKTKVILAKENEKDVIYSLTPKELKKIKIVYVETVQELIEKTFLVESRELKLSYSSKAAV